MKQPYLLPAALLLFALPTACGSDKGDETPEPADPIHTVVVAADGSGDYTTVQEAFDALPVDNKPHIVRLRPGTYEEKVTLTSRHPYVTLIGDDAATCIITWDDYAGRDNGAGGTLGTSGCQTFLIEANDFTASNVTIANTYVNSQANIAADGKDSQAVGRTGSSNVARSAAMG